VRSKVLDDLPVPMTRLESARSQQRGTGVRANGRARRQGLTDESPGAFRSTAAAVIAFGVAMGYLEAAVVVYLRSAIEAGTVVPAYDPATFGSFEAIEIARELATIVMISAVGWLAGRTRLERLAWAAVVFGAWDIVYYLGLRLAIGWPPSLETWDVLLLVPGPWVSPVWAPIVVSAALVTSGLAAARRARAGRQIVVGPVQTIAALAGGGLVVLSFLVDTDRVLAGDLSPWTGWPIFWSGIALATTATVSALGGRRPEVMTTDSEVRGGVESSRARRPG